MAIEIAPEVFGEYGDRHSNEHVIIVGSADPHAAGTALARAGARFGSVAEDGRELTEEEYEEAADLGIYTPNYVSFVFLGARGPWCYVDCKGSISPLMRERMIAVLTEELDRAGVRGRVEVPDKDELDYTAPTIS